MNNVNTPAPSVDTTKKPSNTFLGMDFSNIDPEKFRKAYSLMNPQMNTSNANSTSGLSAFGSALSGIANAYMATDGFNFDKTPSANTDK